MKKNYIGIDIGTSGVKLLLIDEEKNILSQTSREYEVSNPKENWSEIDPLIWYEKTIDGLHELLKGQNTNLVSVIGVTGQMHTLILLDEKGNSLRPAILWNDKRTAKYIPLLREKLSKTPEGDYLSKIVSTGSPLANLYWFSREEPELFKRCRHFLIGPDYIVYKLTGIFGTDFVEASTSSMFYIQKREWAKEIQDFIGLPFEAYPIVRGSAQIIGKILPDLAREFNLPVNVNVIVGTGDNPATAISTGCIGNGYPVLSLGTSGVITFPLKSFNDYKKGKVILFSNDSKIFSFLIQGVVQSTGESINWWLRKILGFQDFGTLDNLINDDIIQNSQLLFYPHINGEKTIYSDPKLRGAFIGLRSETTSAEMYYSLLEGLCFAVKELFEKVGLKLNKNEALKVVGGGSKSNLWLQILSDVLNIRVERLSGVTGPSFGVAMLAYHSEHPNETIISKLQIEHTFIPESKNAGIYKNRYSQYLRIHDALKYISGETN